MSFVEAPLGGGNKKLTNNPMNQGRVMAQLTRAGQVITT